MKTRSTFETSTTVETTKFETTPTTEQQQTSTNVETTKLETTYTNERETSVQTSQLTTSIQSTRQTTTSDISSKLNINTNYPLSTTTSSVINNGWQCISYISKCYKLTNSLNVHGKPQCSELGIVNNASFELAHHYKMFINFVTPTDDFWLNINYVNNTWVWTETGWIK